MVLNPTKKFEKLLSNFPESIRKKFSQQAEYLVKDIRHPSLRAKKFNEAENIWQARVNKEVRFYFQIKGDVYILLDIRKHLK